MAIHFYSQRGLYGWLSNFSPHGFTLDGKYWPTAEHYYQAAKFLETWPFHAEEIRQASSPAKAKELGNRSDVPIRGDWRTVRIAIMRQAVLRKFESHADIRRALLETGDEILVENARRDSFWGCGANGEGKNRLGVVLMEVRVQLRQAE